MLPSIYRTATDSDRILAGVFSLLSCLLTLSPLTDILESGSTHPSLFLLTSITSGTRLKAVLFVLAEDTLYSEEKNKFLTKSTRLCRHCVLFNADPVGPKRNVMTANGEEGCCFLISPEVLFFFCHHVVCSSGAYTTRPQLMNCCYTISFFI